MSYTYTQSKKVVELMFKMNDFGNSTEYKNQSPFNESKSFPSVSTWELWYDVLDNYSFSFDSEESIGVLFNIEVVLLLIEDFGINPKQITLFSDNENKSALAESWGVSVKYIEEQKNMNFTHVIKNPPWDQGVYTKFWPLAEDLLVDNGYQIDIYPTNWMTLPSFQKDRDFLLENFEIKSIKIYDNSKGQVFEAQPGGDVIVMVSQKKKNPNNTLVEWTYFNNTTFTVDLTKHSIWPMYQSALGAKIFDMVVSAKKHDLICNSGRGEDLPDYFIAAPTKVHSRDTKDFMTRPGTRWEKNTLKGIADEQVFEFKNSLDCDLHYQWMSTDIFAYCLAMAKSQGKNQPKPIMYLGEHDFKDNNFVKHFSFTKQHLDEVATWKSQK